MASASPPSPSIERFRRQPGASPIIYGHRGAHGDMPENTMPAFQYLVDCGLRAVELDVQTTADGVPIIHHDPHVSPYLARKPNGEWLTELGPKIVESSVEQLKSYDIGTLRPGSDYQQRFPHQAQLNQVTIPTLEEFCHWAQNYPDLLINIEVKSYPWERLGMPGSAWERRPPGRHGDARMGVSQKAPDDRSTGLPGSTDLHSAGSQGVLGAPSCTRQETPAWALGAPSCTRQGSQGEREDKGEREGTKESQPTPKTPQLCAPPEQQITAINKIIQAYGLSSQVLISSFDWRILSACARIAPHIPRGYLTQLARPGANNLEANIYPNSTWMHGAHWQTDGTLTNLSQQLNYPPPNQSGNPSANPTHQSQASPPNHLDQPTNSPHDQLANSLPDLIHQLGGQAWAPHHQDLTPQSLHRAHQLGLITNTWTVNNPKEIKHLTQVDGIITDYPRHSTLE